MGEAIGFDEAAEAIFAGARATLGVVGWSQVMQGHYYEDVLLGAVHALGARFGMGPGEVEERLCAIARRRHSDAGGEDAVDLFDALSAHRDPSFGAVMLLNHDTQIRRGTANRETRERSRFGDPIGGLFDGGGG